MSKPKCLSDKNYKQLTYYQKLLEDELFSEFYKKICPGLVLIYQD